MNARQRVLTAMQNGKPDHVPCVPDLWEMVPIRLSDRPSWEILVYEDPPIWQARMDAYRHFGVDAAFGLFVPLTASRSAIICQDDNKLITRDFVETDAKKQWSPFVNVFPKAGPSAHRVRPASLGLPDEPESYQIVSQNYRKLGKEYFADARQYVGNDGVVAPMVCLPAIPVDEEQMLRFYDYREQVTEELNSQGHVMMQQVEEILRWEPDALMIGNSGMMIANPPQVFRQIGLRWLQKVTRLAKDHGVPTLLHCCGPERALVEMAANETDLSCIEPLEIPPMGDCDLAELKQSFGHKIALKGNLHTTNIMLMGSPRQVEDACKKAIDDAANGGGFILSTGDQTPRDVPEETIHIMRRVAETYGKY